MRHLFISLSLIVLSSIFVVTITAHISDKSNILQDEGSTPIPVLFPGVEGNWDSADVRDPFVVYADEIYYMFYSGKSDDPEGGVAIGYATSEDGILWTKSPDNPVFTADGTGFDAAGVAAPVVLREGEQWVLYYGSISEGQNLTTAIGRATTTDLSGLWERDEHPIIAIEEGNTWDSFSITPGSVVQTDPIESLYYSAFSRRGHIGIGLAQTYEGDDWMKYDNPETTGVLYSSSDPVLPGVPGAWDEIVWAPYVQKQGDLWHMVYHGDPFSNRDQMAIGLGYATSEDGITWVRYEDNPILTLENSERFPHTPSFITISGSIYLYYASVRTENGSDSYIELAIDPFP